MKQSSLLFLQWINESRSSIRNELCLELLFDLKHFSIITHVPSKYYLYFKIFIPEFTARRSPIECRICLFVSVHTCV